jgi:serine/threonine-protein kinase
VVTPAVTAPPAPPEATTTAITPPPTATASAAVTASAVASADAPPATSAAPPGDPVDSLPLRITLVKSARTRDWGRGGEALVGLIDADPAALRRPDVAVAARDVTAALERESGAEKLFTALARGPGDEGLNVLYEIVQAKGGSHAAVRAAEILRQDAVLSRATPALRSAFRLRDASCVDKIPLFDLAAKEGDGRALIVMETQGRACFKKSRELDFAIKALKDRLIRSAAAR